MAQSSRSDAVTADLSVVRRQITELVARNAVAMVQNAIDAVNEEGQYQAIKFLFEMIGLYPVQENEESSNDPSLAEILLRQLGIQHSTDKTKQGSSSQPGSVDPLQ